MSSVRTDFSAGVKFSRKLGKAAIDGVTAVSASAQGISSIGMFNARNIIKPPQGVVSKRTGLRYFPGAGAPIGGYPGVRSGNLERTLGIGRARHVGKGVVSITFGSSATYALAVHGTNERPKRPFLLLPFRNNRDELMRAFKAAAKKALG